MSPTARLALTVVCWMLALLSEVVGLLLLVAESRRTGRALRRRRQVARDEEGRSVEERELDDLVDVLSGNAFDRGTAVTLLVVGVVVGTVGNLLTL